MAVDDPASFEADDGALPVEPGPRREPRNVTIVDVAREAGVSIRTVSRVLNRERHVGADKLAAVKAVIDRLAFVPSATARSLPGGRSYTLALIFESLSANYMFDIQMAVVEQCHRHGHRLIVEQFTSDMLASSSVAQDAVANLRVDSAIVLPPTSDNPLLLDALDAAGVRYARIAPTGALDRSDAVVMDDEAATQAMVAHLVALGHARIGFVVGSNQHPSARKRLAAFWTAIGHHGLDPAAITISQGDYTYYSGVVAGRALLQAEHRPTAIFASNDAMAAGVIAAAGMHGLVTPRDLSVAGFDDSPLARHIWPPLTTIHQPLTEMARAAAEQLLVSKKVRRLIKFDFELLARASTTVPFQNRATA